MSNNPLNQIKNTKKESAWNREDEAEQEEVDAEQETGKTKRPKLSTKLSDYPEQVKKTTIEVPASVLQEWTIQCAHRGLKKREHLFELLVKDMNKHLDKY